MSVKKFGNVADDFISTNLEESQNNLSKKSPSPKRGKGKQRADDIKSENIKKLSVYVTDEQAKKVGIWAIKNDLDKSAAMRHIINTFFENKEKI